MLQDRGAETEPPARIVVGLGNPGARYARTRHNAGFMALEALARELGGAWCMGPLSRICRIGLGGARVLLVEPLTYMNLSGEALVGLLSAFRREPRDLLLVVDDLNLPFGRIRIRERGSAGGHRGLESVLRCLNTEEIVRVRMGIGEDPMPEDKAEFVLSDFPQHAQAELDAMILRAGNAIRSVVSEGVSKTMAMFNA